MKLFHFLADCAYPDNGTKAYEFQDGQAAVVIRDKDTRAFVADDGKKAVLEDEIGIFINNKKANEGGLFIPFNKNKLTYAKAEYVAPVKFKGTLKITEAPMKGEYTISITKKGVDYGEKMNWIVSHYIDDVGYSIKYLCETLIKLVNNNTIQHGIKASLTGSDTIVFDASETGVDYTIAPGGKFKNLQLTSVTAGYEGNCTREQIIALANSCIGGYGVYDTHQSNPLVEGVYPFVPEDNSTTQIEQFGVFHLSFVEERKDRLEDLTLRQKVHLAFKLNNQNKEAFDKVFRRLLGETIE